MKKRLKLLSVLLSAVLVITSALPMQAVAAEKQKIVYKNGNYVAEKLSNPTSGQGEADGLVDGGDRLNSYAWSMEALCDQYGDYLYIGGNRGIITTVSSTFVSALSAEMGEENAKALFNLLYNGDVPMSENPLDYASSCIVRYNMKTGKMEKWFDSADYINGDEPYYKLIYGFRSAKSFNGAIYMNAMTESGSAIYRISSNNQKKPEIVLRGSGELNLVGNSQNLRAMAVSEDKKTLYIGGVQSVQDPETQELSIIIYQSTDGNTFKPIADYKDFEFYEKKNAGYISTTGDVWDMAEYKGELYMTVTTPKGALVFKAHKAKPGEKANDYGWVWEELCGNNGGKFTTGFGNSKNCAITPYVYKDDLYFITFSNVIDPIVEFGYAMGEYFSAEEKDISVVLDSYKSMVSLMENETSIYRLTKDGKWQMTMGDKDKCVKGIDYVAKLGSGFNNDEYGTTAYNWREAIYNGKLYIGTLDDSGMYKYTTKLTCGDLLDMNDKEFRRQLDYLVTFLKGIVDSKKATLNGTLLTTKSTLLGTKISDLMLDQLLDSLVNIQGILNRDATVDAMENVLMTLPRVKKTVNNLYNRIDLLSKILPKTLVSRLLWKQLLTNVGSVKNRLDSIDTEGLESYVIVSRTIADNKNQGFELYSTKDGINFETVTLNGFNDKYNLGARTLLATDYGLMVGTANSYYGAQLWKVTENNKKIKIKK